MVDENRKGNKLFLETIKEIYFDDPQAKNSTLYDLAWREKIDEWLSEEVVLTENQHKLDQELLTALKSINCYYLDFYNHNDFLYDHPGTKRLEEFLGAYKNDPDLQVVLNLKRGRGERTILEKVTTRNILAVHLLLRAGADPNIKNEKGRTPLYYAAKYDNTGIVDVLLAEKSINVNTKDNQGKTPLHYAVFHCHTEVISRLLTEEAIDINAQDNEGKAPLHHATFWEVDNEMIDILVNGGAKVDVPDNEGNTPLQYAANFGFVDSVGLLAAKSNNVNLINKNGDTALHVALNNKDECVPEAILDHAENIDFHIKNREGESPLLFAAGHSTENIVKKIISKNVKVDKYCLHKAVVNDYTGAGLRTAKNDIYIHDYDYFNDTDDRINNSEDTQCRIVNLFIRLGLDVNIMDKNGNTPLLYAVEYRNDKVAQELVSHGANRSIRNKGGHTVFEYAIKANKLNLQTLSAVLPKRIQRYIVGNEETEVEEVEVVDNEKAKEILSKIRDNDGNTLLHWAVRYGCKGEILNFLVENGVDINEKNNNGVAPIHIAAKYGREHLIDFFIKNKAEINVQCGKFTRSELNDLEKVYGTGSFAEGEFIDVRDSETGNKDDIKYKKTTPVAIATSNNHEQAVKTLLLQGVKPNVGNNKGWMPVHIAIRVACDNNYGEEEREKAYRMIEKLAIFSDRKVLGSLVEGKGSLIAQMVSHNERVRNILRSALANSEGSPLATAPIEELDDNYFSQGIIMEELPNIYPNLLEELEELEENTIDSRDEGQSIEQKPDKKSTKQKIESVSKMRLGFHDRERLNKFLYNLVESEDIAELNQVVSEALNSGVRLKVHKDQKYGFVDLVMAKVAQLNGTKQNPKVVSDILCKLVVKGADINKKDYEKINQELEEVFKDHKTNIQKAYLEANKRIDDFHKAVASATTGKIELIEIDNTTFYLECLADSTVDVAKAIEAARGLGLYDGNITFGGNIIKIGKVEVEIETSNGTRNYTDLSDNGDVIITFQTSLGKLDVRLYNSTEYEDFIEVEVCNPERFNQLVDIKEEVGKNCLLGGLSIYDAIKQGYFERSGKFQPSETISCKRPESSETVSFIPQDAKEGVEKVMKSVSGEDISSSGKDIWANRIQAKRTNEGCSRGV